jgi:hypothetical protein
MKSVAFFSTLALGAVSAFQQSSPIRRTQRLDVAFARPDCVVEDAPTTVTLESTKTCDLPPVLRNIVDERAEFQINLGRAMDVLRSDYPTILFQQPGKFCRGNGVNESCRKA